MKIWRKYPKGSLFVGAGLVAGLSFGWIIAGFGVPKAVPGSWELAVEKRNDEFQVVTELEAWAEYRVLVLGLVKNGDYDPYYGKLEVAVLEPNQSAYRELTPHPNNGEIYLDTGIRSGKYVFRGRVVAWTPEPPRLSELESVEVRVDGRPHGTSTWAAMGLFFAGLFTAIYAILWGAIATMREMSARRRRERGLP